MKNKTITHKRLTEIYGALGVPEVGKTYRIDLGFKRIEHLMDVTEVTVLSVTLTDVYVKNHSTGRRTNHGHHFFKQYQEAAIQKDRFIEMHQKQQKSKGAVVIQGINKARSSS